eukprot:1346817-Ditylum_brightwellii.AAC.1
MEGMQPLVWQLEWPPEVKGRINSTANLEGDLFINDLELARLAIGWLILEWDQPSLKFKNVG